MSLTITFGTPLTVAAPANGDIDTGSASTVSVSTVTGQQTIINDVTGVCVQTGVDNNGITRNTTFNLSAGTVTSIKADLQTKLSAEFSGNTITVS